MLNWALLMLAVNITKGWAAPFTDRLMKQCVYGPMLYPICGKDHIRSEIHFWFMVIVNYRLCGLCHISREGKYTAQTSKSRFLWWAMQILGKLCSFVAILKSKKYCRLATQTWFHMLLLSNTYQKTVHKQRKYELHSKLCQRDTTANSC